VLDHGANDGILDFAVMEVYADFVTDFELSRRSIGLVRWHPLPEAILSCEPPLLLGETISGVTTIRARFHPSQHRRVKTEKSLSKAASLDLGCFRFSTSGSGAKGVGS